MLAARGADGVDDALDLPRLVKIGTWRRILGDQADDQVAHLDDLEVVETQLVAGRETEVGYGAGSSVSVTLGVDSVKPQATTASNPMARKENQ